MRRISIVRCLGNLGHGAAFQNHRFGACRVSLERAIGRRFGRLSVVGIQFGLGQRAFDDFIANRLSLNRARLRDQRFSRLVLPIFDLRLEQDHPRRAGAQRSDLDRARPQLVWRNLEADQSLVAISVELAVEPGEVADAFRAASIGELPAESA